MIKNQEELRAALQTSQVQQDKILQLEAEKAQLESRLSDPPEDSLVEDLQIQVLLKYRISYGPGGSPYQVRYRLSKICVLIFLFLNLLVFSTLYSIKCHPILPHEAFSQAASQRITAIIINNWY